MIGRFFWQRASQVSAAHSVIVYYHTPDKMSSTFLNFVGQKHGSIGEVNSLKFWTVLYLKIYHVALESDGFAKKASYTIDLNTIESTSPSTRHSFKSIPRIVFS